MRGWGGAAGDRERDAGGGEAGEAEGEVSGGTPSRSLRPQWQPDAAICVLNTPFVRLNNVTTKLPLMFVSETCE